MQNGVEKREEEREPKRSQPEPSFGIQNYWDSPGVPWAPKGRRRRECAEWDGEEGGGKGAKKQPTGTKREPKGSPKEAKREPKLN